MNNIAKLDTDPTEKVDFEVDSSTHDAWKASWADSFQLQDFMDEDELEWLKEHMLKRYKKMRVKESGTLHFFSDNAAIEDKFFDKWNPIQFCLVSKKTNISQERLWLVWNS